VAHSEFRSWSARREKKRKKERKKERKEEGEGEMSSFLDLKPDFI
jgi:hypothetical protein